MCYSKNNSTNFGVVFLILIVVKGKFVVRIYTIKSYETMTHRCRGHHWCPVWKLTFLFVFVLCRYYKFIVCKQDNNPIGITLSLRANDVRPYTYEPKVCCNFVLCSYPKFVHICQSPLCKGRCFANAKQRDCHGRLCSLNKGIMPYVDIINL